MLAVDSSWTGKQWSQQTQHYNRVLLYSEINHQQEIDQKSLTLRYCPFRGNAWLRSLPTLPTAPHKPSPQPQVGQNFSSGYCFLIYEPYSPKIPNKIDLLFLEASLSLLIYQYHFLLSPRAQRKWKSISKNTHDHLSFPTPQRNELWGIFGGFQIIQAHYKKLQWRKA